MLVLVRVVIVELYARLRRFEAIEEMVHSMRRREYGKQQQGQGSAETEAALCVRYLSIGVHRVVGAMLVGRARRCKLDGVGQMFT
ncbi:MAG: hypothetical protein EXR70_03445 [Deltaproteobacteria bacterium]|nr:hypothetical protein [Deltaproteobacteria bacterium]